MDRERTLRQLQLCASRTARPCAPAAYVHLRTGHQPPFIRMYRAGVGYDSHNCLWPGLESYCRGSGQEKAWSGLTDS